MTDDHFAEEIRSHVAHEADRLIASGVDPAEAYAAARRRFGNVTQVAEVRRESRPIGFDVNRLRLAVRRLRRAPLFAIGVVTMLGMAVGMATLAFGALYAVALRPLPFKNPATLVQVWAEDDTRLGAGSQDVVDNDLLRLWRSGQTSFSDFSAYASISLTPHSRITDPFEGAHVDGRFFKTLGIGMMLGRPIMASDEDGTAAPVMVLSDPLWRRAFGSDPGVIGTTWRLNTTTYTIVGVAPATADIPGGEAWVSQPGTTNGSAPDHYIGLARLKSGVSIAKAQAQLASLVPLGASDPADAARRGALLVPLAQSLRRISQTLILVIAAIALLLAVALANLGTLFLVRMLGRLKQSAISTALGATSARLRTDAVIEGLLLGAGAAIIGIVLAAWAATALQSFISNQLIQRPEAIPLGAPVVGFALVFGIAAGALLAAVPEQVTRRLDVTEYLRGGGAGSGMTRRQSRWRRGLVGLQVAGAVIAAVAAVALLRSSQYLAHVDVGYDPNRMIVAPLDLDNTQYQTNERAHALANRIDADLASMPDIGPPAIWTSLGFPMPRSSAEEMMVAEGSALRMDSQHCNFSKCAFAIEPVSTNLFATFGIARKAGRLFDATDRPGSAAVVIINERAAQVWWPGQDVIGKRIRIGGETEPWRTVVGMVADAAPLDGMGRLARAIKTSNIQPLVYEPLAQADVTNRISGGSALFVAVRAAGGAPQTGARLHRELAALLPDMQVASPTTMQKFLQDDDYTAELLGWHTVIAVTVTVVTLLLALLGVTGVVAESVRHRTRELGVRLALGATRNSIVRLICVSALQWLASGVAAGVVATLLLRPVISRIVFHASSQFPDGVLQFGPAHHAAVLVGTMLTILVVGLVAAYVPARAAAGLDPLSALRAGND